MRAHPAGSSALPLALLSQLAAVSLPAQAEDVAAGAAAVDDGMAMGPGGIALVTAPILLYGIFYVYRSQINPKATLVDGITVLAAVAIVGNIVSILAFQTRIF